MIRSLSIFLVLLAGSALAQSGRPATQWIVDPNTKCKVANATPSAAETLTWSGTCKDGYADGKGVAQWFKAKKATQKKYDGEMSGGFMNGQGLFIQSNGDRFEGTFKDGSLNGSGKATWFNKNKYEGQWKDGYPNGTGTYLWADGKRYTGEWVNGKQTGDGDFKFSNGDHYVGQMKDGLMSGKGKFVWADAKIDGATIVVSSPAAPAPTTVRYAWGDGPVFNLYNQAGLPASPFRTDVGSGAK